MSEFEAPSVKPKRTGRSEALNYALMEFFEVWAEKHPVQYDIYRTRYNADGMQMVKALHRDDVGTYNRIKAEAKGSGLINRRAIRRGVASAARKQAKVEHAIGKGFSWLRGRVEEYQKSQKPKRRRTTRPRTKRRPSRRGRR